jgi:hypothetical protein
MVVEVDLNLRDRAFSHPTYLIIFAFCSTYSVPGEVLR